MGANRITPDATAHAAPGHVARSVQLAPADAARIKSEMLRLVSSGWTATRAAGAIGISVRTINDWKHRDAEFATAWRLARIEQAHCLADEIIDIADEQVEGNMAAVQRNRLRVDTRKWFCSKVAPRFYGDRLTVSAESDPGTCGVIILPALDATPQVKHTNYGRPNPAGTIASLTQVP